MIDPPPLNVVGEIALVIGVLILGLVVHEFGHALAACLVGFHVRLIRLDQLAIVATPAGWRMRLLRPRIRGGWVAADPVRPEHLRVRHAVFVAGGPAAHLLLAGVMFAASGVWGGAPEVAAVLLLITVGWNLVPLGLRREGRWLDGDWLLAWAIRPRLAMQRVALGTLYQAVEAGERPREWDGRWARLVEKGMHRPTSSNDVAGNLLGYCAALDEGRVNDAGRLLARSFAGRNRLPAEQCAAVLVEAAFFVARHRRRNALAAKLLAAAPQPSSKMGTADLERARAAIHLAAGDRVEAAAACHRALAALDSTDGRPPGLVAFDRDQVSAIHTEAIRPT